MMNDTTNAPAQAVPIVALDVGDHDAALALARRVGPAARVFKVGMELFTAAGPDVVRALRGELGADVFLDLKFNDIPNTVAGAVRSAARLGVRLLTVHASGGRAMLDAAQGAWRDSAADPTAGGVLGVTVLTSFDAEGLAAAWGRERVEVSREVVRLAGDAAESGLHGVVCSGAEAGLVREAFGGLSILVPGIRLAGGAAHDQRRVVTPVEAWRSGARYLVLGRAVTAASDPTAALGGILAELAGAGRGR